MQVIRVAWGNFLYNFEGTDLREIPVGLVQHFHDDFCLVHQTIVPKLFTDSFKDLGKCPLTKTLHLEGKRLFQFQLLSQCNLAYYNSILIKYWNLMRNLLQIDVQIILTKMQTKLTNSRSSFLILWNTIWLMLCRCSDGDRGTSEPLLLLHTSRQDFSEGDKKKVIGSYWKRATFCPTDRNYRNANVRQIVFVRKTCCSFHNICVYAFGSSLGIDCANF